MSELSKKIGIALEAREKINEQKSDYDDDNQWLASNTDQYAGIAVEKLGHTHNLMIDSHGCGRTSIDEGHFHMIEMYDIIPELSDKHTHVLKMQETTEAETSVGYCSVYDEKGKRIPSEVPKPHTHSVILDEYGNGITTENNNHFHKVKVFAVLASKDGHSHYDITKKRLIKGKSPWNLGV